MQKLARLGMVQLSVLCLDLPKNESELWEVAQVNDRHPVIVWAVVKEELLSRSSIAQHVASKVSFDADILVDFSDVPDEFIYETCVCEVCLMLQCGCTIYSHCFLHRR